MSDEFGLAEGGEEHVEDRLECFRTECHLLLQKLDLGSRSVQRHTR